MSLSSIDAHDEIAHINSAENNDSVSSLPDLMVPPAMLCLAGAIGTAGYMHLGLAAELAAALGLTLFCLMLVCHVLLRAADRAENGRGSDYAMVQSPFANPRGSTVPATSLDQTAISEPHIAVLQHGEVGPQIRTEVRADIQPQEIAAALPSIEPVSSSPPQAPALVLPDRGGNQATSGWTYRPLDLRVPTIETGAGLGPVDAASSPGVAPFAAWSQMRPTIVDHAGAQDAPAHDGQTEAQRIDNILKRLANQIRAGVPLLEAQTISANPAVASPAATVPVAVEAGQQHIDAMHAQAVPSELALSSAVDALRSTVETMRASASSVAGPPAPSAAELRLAAVAEALIAERADVMLEPILGLADDQARHFEVSVKLRTESGEVIDAKSMEARARGAGLLPLLDALGVRHSGGFALRLERKGRDGSVFSRISGESLESERFVTDVANRHAMGIADRLVLTFEQAEVRGLGPAQLSALAKLNELGFRFALQGVTDLDMDFDELTALGFQFVKLDAGVFLVGLRFGETEVPAGDLCRHFAGLGLAVIVDRIESEDICARVSSHGVVFGQGALFGAPRPIAVSGQMRDGVIAA